MFRLAPERAKKGVDSTADAAAEIAGAAIALAVGGLG